MLNLSEEFLKRGYRVDLVVNNAAGSLHELAPSGARIIDLNVPRALFAVPALTKYIRQHRPNVLLAAQTYNNIAAILSSKFVRTSTALFVSEHTDLGVVKHSSSIKERLRPSLASIFYPTANGIIAVSKGASQSLSKTANISAEKITTIYNPVVTANMIEECQKELHHPWFGPSNPPVLLSAGRLVPEKDFGTLIRSFARLRKRIAARLIILGEGPERSALERLIEELGLVSDVQLAGFQINPYPYMSKAALFVLSSKREGLSTVLIEAMACGAPVVSTDCPSGPSEILDGGRFGTLIPVGDSEALAKAMEKALKDPTSSELLVARAMEFSVEKKAEQYLQLFFGQVS